MTVKDLQMQLSILRDVVKHAEFKDDSIRTSLWEGMSALKNRIAEEGIDDAG